MFVTLEIRSLSPYRKLVNSGPLTKVAGIHKTKIININIYNSDILFDIKLLEVFQVTQYTSMVYFIRI